MKSLAFFLFTFLIANTLKARTVESDYVFALPRAATSVLLASTNSFSNSSQAIDWLTDKSIQLKRRVTDETYRLNLLRIVHYEASRAELDPNLVLAVIEVESNFRQYAISNVGATGVMQVMPFWKGLIGRADDSLFDMQTNLRYGCNILSFYLEIEKGNISNALARYNGSLGSDYYPNLVLGAFLKYKEN